MMPNKALSRARTMPTNAKPAVVIRDLETVDDLRKVEAVEKEVWGLSDQDTMPLTMIHSHLLAVRAPYRDLDLGYKLKQAQRERALAMGIRQMTWTFDPLQSKNAHFNFAKLGVVSEKYKADFYGLKTSSVLHRNSTDRLWVQWRLSSKRVQQRLQGKDASSESLDALSNLIPMVGFHGDGKPEKTDMET